MLFCSNSFQNIEQFKPKPIKIIGIIVQQLLNTVQLLMDSKALTAKQKKIQKRQRAKQRRKAEKQKPFSFQAQMIDLIESSQVAQNIEPIQQVELKRKVDAQDKIINAQKTNNKIIKIDNDEYYLIVEIGKFYKIKKENEKQVYQINVLLQNQQFSINGLKYQTYSSSNPCIFSVQRQSPVQFKHYEANLPVLAKQKVTKSIINSKRQALIKSPSKIDLQESTQPWVNLPKCIESNESLMLVGVKNTGKSYLAQYLLNSKPTQCMILDCDIGRNSCMEGCVSLSSSNVAKRIWIGELTPLNNLQTYLRAIRYLFEQYKQKWFTKKLIVNTMGYLTGLGQLLLYEIYHIIKPQSILILQSKNEAYYLNNIIQYIKWGKYTQKLYMTQSRAQSPSSTEIHYYQNVHCLAKRSTARFQKMFEAQEGDKVNSIVDLIEVISKSDKPYNKNIYLKSKKRCQLQIYEQSRHGKQEMGGQEVVSYRKLSIEESVDMRLIILGKMIEDNQPVNQFNTQNQALSSLFQVTGLGFGFREKVYFKAESEGLIGIVNEGVDFEKGFYHLNEKQLIDVELKIGRLNFIMVAAQGLGSKGVRNNPSKMT